MIQGLNLQEGAIWEKIIKTQFDIPEKLLNQLIDIGVIYEKL